MKKGKNGFYCTTATINGKRKYFYGKTPQIAVEKRNSFIAKVKDFPYLDDHVTLSEWVEAWLNGIKNTVTEHTWFSYRGVLRRHVIGVPFGYHLLEDLRPALFRVYWQEILDSGLSPRTVCYVHTLVSAALKQAVSDGVIPSNPLDYVRRPKRTPSKSKSLSKSQIRVFFEHVKNEQLRRICHFALTTGMRRSEILGLRWRDVDLDRATVSVTQTCIVLPGSSYTLVNGAKTDSSIRCISIDQGTAEMLRNQHAYFLRLKMQYPKNRNCDLVFPSQILTPVCPDNVTHAAKKAFIAAGLPEFSFHSFRHTHATFLIESGINYKIVQERLGHSSVQTTLDTYTHVTQKMDEEAAEIASHII